MDRGVHRTELQPMRHKLKWVDEVQKPKSPSEALSALRAPSLSLTGAAI